MTQATDVRPTDPLPLVLLVLTATTGLVDSVSVLGLGQVFVANMTGNTVFLAFAVADVVGFEAARYLVAVAAFLAGAAVAGLLAERLQTGPRRRWLVAVAVLEAALLAGASLWAIGYDPSRLAPPTAFYGMIILTALAMGLRNATVRRLSVPDLTTTVLTLTFAGFAADAASGKGRTSVGRRVGAAACLFAGAIVGALMVKQLGLAPPLALAALLVLAPTVAYAWHPASGARSDEPRKGG